MMMREQLTYRMLGFSVVALVLIFSSALLAVGQGSSTCAKDVIVKQDDWLSKIAQRELGSVFAFPQIVDATNAKASIDASYTRIFDPNIIRPGWKICIPGTEAVTDASRSKEVTIDITNGSTLRELIDKVKEEQGEDALDGTTSNKEIDLGIPGFESLTRNKPLLALDENVAAIAWANTDDGGIYISVSDAQGEEWSDPILMNKNRMRDASDDSPLIHQLRLNLSVVDDRIYVAWMDLGGSDLEEGELRTDVIFNTYDTQTGQVEGEQIVDEDLPREFSSLRFAMTGNDDRGRDQVVLLVRMDPEGEGSEEPWVITTRNGGNSFTTNQVRPLLEDDIDMDDLAVASNGSRVYSMWVDNRVKDEATVWMVRSFDGGVTFAEDDVSLGDAGVETTGFDTNEPVIVTSGSQVVAAWEETVAPDGKVRAIRAAGSTNNGAKFSGDKNVGGYTKGEHNAQDPTLAIAPNGDVVLAWSDNRTGEYEVYAMTSINGGDDWSKEVQLSEGGGQFADCVATNDGVVCAWDGTGENAMIQGAYTMKGGSTWSETFTLSDNDEGTASGASVAFSERENLVFVSWRSDETGEDLVYRRTFNPRVSNTLER